MVLVATGILCVLDAVATVVWQEPVTAIYGKVRQGDLGGDLDKLNARPLTGSEQDVLRELRENRQRVSFLARAMRRVTSARYSSIGSRRRRSNSECSWALRP
jgi:sortase A